MESLFEKIKNVANSYLPEFLEKNKAYISEEKRGLYLSGYQFVPIEDEYTMSEGGGAVIGHLPVGKRKETRFFSTEKSTRLLNRRLSGHKDRTSLVTQSYRLSQYGGAVCADIGDGRFYILSASNLPPFYDTLFVIDVLFKAGLIDEAQQKQIKAEATQHEHTGE